ncbi:MAG: protein-export chaperone SecB [Alphaproteobacteria bacterium]
MADEDSNPQSQEVAQTPPLTLTAQYVKDLSFENPGAPQSLGDLNPPPAIKVDVDVEAKPLGGRYFEALIHVRATAEREDKTFFVAEVSYGGVCAVAEGVPDEHIQPLVMIEGPRLLFPFARAVIADAVRDGGFPPLLINPIDFAALFQQMQSEPAAEA